MSSWGKMGSSRWYIRLMKSDSVRLELVVVVFFSYRIPTPFPRIPSSILSITSRNESVSMRCRLHDDTYYRRRRYRFGTRGSKGGLRRSCDIVCWTHVLASIRIVLEPSSFRSVEFIFRHTMKRNGARVSDVEGERVNRNELRKFQRTEVSCNFA